MFYGTRTNWEDVSIIWTLEIDFLGDEYRFSSFPFDFEDEDGKSIPFIGGLEDVEVTQSLQTVGDISSEQDSLSFAITFPNRNIAQDQMNGKLLEGCQARVGYVLISQGQIISSYSDRPIIFKGIITTPVYGHPDREVGYVEFSVENKVFISSQGLLATVIGENMYLEDVSCSNALYVEPEFTYDRGLVEVQDIHRGKPIPWVFGELFSVQHSSGEDSSLPITPAYVIAFDPSGPSQPIYYLIAGHVTNATSVNLFSNTGESDSSTVSSFVNIDNRVFSYVAIPNSSAIPHTVHPNDDRQVWVEWDDGAPFPSPVSEGDLKGGGDICLWLISQLTDDIDWGAWEALRPYLNQYSFGGYVNDDKITIYQFLQKNILAYLPIHVVVGPYGLKPILDMNQTGLDLSPRLSITANEDWERVSPIITQETTEDLANVITVRYAFNGVSESYSTFVQVQDKIPANGNLASISYIAHPKSLISIQRYGKKKKVVELDYCYDNNTAQRIAQDILAREALPNRTVQYSVSIRYGYLVLGDIVEIIDEDIGLNGQRCQIIQKVFSNNRWLIDLKIDENPNRYERNV